MNTTRLQVQVPTKVLTKVKRKISNKGLSTFNVQDLVQIFLVQVADKGINFDLTINADQKKIAWEESLPYYQASEELEDLIDRAIKDDRTSSQKTLNSPEDIANHLDKLDLDNE